MYFATLFISRILVNQIKYQEHKLEMNIFAKIYFLFTLVVEKCIINKGTIIRESN